MPDFLSCPACHSRLRDTVTQEGPGAAALDAEALERILRELLYVAKPLDVAALDALLRELRTVVMGVVHIKAGPPSP